ncbi:hypothetical protein [Kutzneria sp. NPDC052558]|uniref:hypothetical protein n=1 Tax=Kutzneria sp. NPDC052558 TaxID=3364121 RepID=UPI0037C94BD7
MTSDDTLLSDVESFVDDDRRHRRSPVTDTRLAASEARACPTFDEARRLAMWLGPSGRPITPKGVLRPSDVPEIAQVLATVERLDEDMAWRRAGPWLDAHPPGHSRPAVARGGGHRFPDAPDDRIVSRRRAGRQRVASMA